VGATSGILASQKGPKRTDLPFTCTGRASKSSAHHNIARVLLIQMGNVVQTHAHTHTRGHKNRHTSSHLRYSAGLGVRMYQ
jgi:hypothetical protein